MTALTNLYTCKRVHVIYNVPDHVETGYVIVLDTDRLSEDTPHIAATRNIVNQVLRHQNMHLKYATGPSLGFTDREQPLRPTCQTRLSRHKVIPAFKAILYKRFAYRTTHA